MDNRMSRRQFLRVAAVTGGTGFLAACVAVTPQSGQSGTMPAEEPATLRLITHYGSPERREFTQRVKEIYEASHPGVTVEVEVAPDIDVRWQTEVAARTLPVMLWDANLFCEMAEQDVFLSLNSRLEAQSSTLDMADYNIPTGAECMVSHHDQQVAMPWINAAPLLYYNVDMFDAAGIERPSDDWTWEEFLAISQELTRDADGDGAVDQWGYMQGNSWDEDFLQWVWSNDGLAISDDFTQTTLDTPETRDALQFVHDLRFVHNVWPKAEEAEAMAAVGIGNPFASGKIGMFYTNTGGIGNFNRTITDFTYDILHFPKSPNTGRRSLWTFMQNFAAPSWSEHPDLDADLVILLGGPSSQAWAARTKLQVPTYRPAVENEYNTQPPENIRVVPEMYAGEDVRHQPIFKGRSEWVQTVFGSELSKAFIGEAALDDAIATAIDAGNRVLERAAN